MGAGSCEDHFIQDAGELYFTFIVQKEFSKRGINNVGVVLEKETEFNDYCLERKITEMFETSDYKKNMDICLENFVDKLIEKYPLRKIDIRNVEVEYRNKGLKGDFILQFDDMEIVSVSLKNYKKGYNSIQLCSGTWHSLINNNVLKLAEGPGMYIDCETGKEFRAQKKCKKQRDNNYIKLGYKEIILELNKIDTILNEIKEKYIKSETARYYENIEKDWVEDCLQYGNKGIDIVINALDRLPKERLLENLLRSSDLCHTEELLLIGKGGEMMCSLFNDRYKELLVRVNKKECTLSYSKHMKNLRMTLSDLAGEILHIDIPFTLQKNGAWFLPKEKYEGTHYHPKEKKDLVYGERRPKKCKELNTSTNMWFKIGDYV